MLLRENRSALTEWSFSFEGQEPAPVTLPHTWNATDTMDTNLEAHYRRGIGRYTTTLEAQSFDERLWLLVEAAAMEATLYLDGDRITHHAGGYTAFEVDISDALDGLPHQLHIDVDNRPNPNVIPSDMSDFFLYGGLTRKVWLYQTGPLRLGHPQVTIETTRQQATMHLAGRVFGELGEDVRLRVELTAPNGGQIFTLEHDVEAAAFSFGLPTVENPLLWSPGEPNLYELRFELYAGGTLSDAGTERVGFRWFDFPEGGPFYLNGERLLLRGTHRHEDWAGYGSAVPDAITRREFEMIKAAGFNFVRLGHYPQSAEALRACDELGLIVWEELPWCRGGIGGEAFRSNARQQLTEMITQHHNHPSIIFWGLGNELDWESEHPGSSEEQVLDFLGELHELTYHLDSTRLTALRRFDKGAAVVDVYSPSIWAGWYRGRYEDYERSLTEAMERYPRLLHMEWGGDSHVGRHSEGVHLPETVRSEFDTGEIPGTATSTEGPPRASRDSDWSESYMLDLMAWHLTVQNRLPKLAGTAQWVFSDFGTPLRPENPIPYINQKGLADRVGRPKDVYYLFQAVQTAAPVLYIESETWPVRPIHREVPVRVRVITNCEQVELFVDDVSCGVRSLPEDPQYAATLWWELKPQPGEHVLHAVGNADGITHTIQQTWVEESQNPPARLVPRHVEGQVDVQIVDADGRPITGQEIRLRATSRGLRGTPDGSRVVDTANGRATFTLTDDALTITALDANIPPLEADYDHG